MLGYKVELKIYERSLTNSTNGTHRYRNISPTSAFQLHTSSYLITQNNKIERHFTAKANIILSSKKERKSNYTTSENAKDELSLAVNCSFSLSITYFFHLQATSYELIWKDVLLNQKARYQSWPRIQCAGCSSWRDASLTHGDSLHLR